MKIQIYLILVLLFITNLLYGVEKNVEHKKFLFPQFTQIDDTIPKNNNDSGSEKAKKQEKQYNPEKNAKIANKLSILGWLLSLYGLPVEIIALFMSAKAYYKLYDYKNPKKNKAKTGLIISLIYLGLLCGSLLYVLFFFFLFLTNNTGFK